jgi:hypothetical protein
LQLLLLDIRVELPQGISQDTLDLHALPPGIKAGFQSSQVQQFVDQGRDAVHAGLDATHEFLLLLGQRSNALDQLGITQHGGQR